MNKSLCILSDRKQFDEIIRKQMREGRKRSNRRKLHPLGIAEKRQKRLDHRYNIYAQNSKCHIRWTALEEYQVSVETKI